LHGRGADISRKPTDWMNQNHVLKPELTFARLSSLGRSKLSGRLTSASSESPRESVAVGMSGL